jgi:hypothetical protein
MKSWACVVSGSGVCAGSSGAGAGAATGGTTNPGGPKMLVKLVPGMSPGRGASPLLPLPTTPPGRPGGLVGVVFGVRCFCGDVCAGTSICCAVAQCARGDVLGLTASLGVGRSGFMGFQVSRNVLLLVFAYLCVFLQEAIFDPTAVIVNHASSLHTLVNPNPRRRASRTTCTKRSVTKLCAPGR